MRISKPPIRSSTGSLARFGPTTPKSVGRNSVDHTEARKQVRKRDKPSLKARVHAAENRSS
jgi:hypothetical protein